MSLPTPYYQHNGQTIYCADCREILPELEAGSVDTVLTDPPYGIELQEHGRSGYDWSIPGDHDQSLGHAVLQMCRKRQWPIMVFAHPMYPWATGGWRQYLAWDKGPAVGGGGDKRTCWKMSWELVQICNTGPLNGIRDEAVLRFHVTQGDFHFHPCQKPTALLSYLITKATQSSDVVFDPFLGSGSVLRAAKNLGRRAIGIEIEERYCEIAANRLRQEVFDFGGVT